MSRGKLTLYSLVLQPPPFVQRLSPGHTACDLSAHTRNVRLLSAPSDHEARGVLAQDALTRTPLWPPSNGNFTPQPELSDYPSDEGWLWKENIRAWADHHHVFLPHEQTPRQPTPGPSGTRWSEKLFRGNQPKFHFIFTFTFESSVLTLTPFLEPSQTKEPPIPGLSPSSQPPEDDMTREPEPEVAPTQSTEEPFGKSQFHFFNSTQLFLTPPSTISISSRHSPLHHYH
ncbi:hypothetical protein O181_099997 [Austropuccinia psidii MF-1]|uniref:Uncharacterized protein n=1 Tax=Austropuccinia psidii MF-1 TaxID=1389203 RepID=A0A9Q3JED3_9BASI|nr:hypothetical protein [Austropuccinia psidii MF-1]